MAYIGKFLIKQQTKFYIKNFTNLVEIYSYNHRRIYCYSVLLRRYKLTVLKFDVFTAYPVNRC